MTAPEPLTKPEHECGRCHRIRRQSALYYAADGRWLCYATASCKVQGKAWRRDRPAPDLCECGHERNAHGWSNGRSDCYGPGPGRCDCRAYRPAPTPQSDQPLPTEPGTTGTATVRGVPGVRVMRTALNSEVHTWTSAVAVQHADGTTCFHKDSDVADFVPTQQPEPTERAMRERLRQDHATSRSLPPHERRYMPAIHQAAQPEPTEPTGLVERLARTWLVSQNVGIEDHENAPSTLPGYLDLHAARALALSLADWLDEQRMGLGDVPGDYIRREIGETS